MAAHVHIMNNHVTARTLLLDPTEIPCLVKPKNILVKEKKKEELSFKKYSIFYLIQILYLKGEFYMQERLMI
jgi:hypothetical protein